MSNAEHQAPNTDSLWPELAGVDVADVVVDVGAPDLLPTYSYRVPPSLSAELRPGECVHVPFGAQEKVGYVMGRRRLPPSDPLCARLRDIVGRVDGAVTFSEEQAATAQWISEHYVCDLMSAVRCVAPSALGSRVSKTVKLAQPAVSAEFAGASLVQAHILETLLSLGGEADVEELRRTASVSAFTGSYASLVKKGILVETREVSRPKVVARTARAYALGPAVDSLSGRNSPAGERILEALTQFEREGETPVLPEKLLTRAQASPSALKTLVEKGAVVIVPVSIRRAPQSVPDTGVRPGCLTRGQQAAVTTIAAAIGRAGETGQLTGRWADTETRGYGHESPDHQITRSPPLRAAQRANDPPTFLLFGVTASGKTEVYLDAIERTLNAGRNAIVLVPEIALTTQVVDIFTGRFGDNVAVLHSRLSGGERHDEWRRLQVGPARIAIGARSAIFAPLDNVGLIVVDEEHEASYKQETLPRYNARDVARERARLSGAIVVLGSATPSLESYHASECGQIARLQMPERIDSRPLPEVELVDLRQEMKEHKSLFSRLLVERIGDRLGRGQQAILFLNRRGYSQFVLCRDCGYVARCPNCAVSLALHAAWNALKCHHCDYGRSAPSVCPSCGGTRIRGFGVGTERVEEEVLRYFPSARVARLDRDTTARKGAHAGILRRFRQGDADLLIGTQMVAKGLDFPNVTLVGVVSADTSINMPDFRAAERTFQLLTQVAGRAGRGPEPGEVVIQTFNPEHYSLEMAVHQDYPGFYRKEIAFREELRYPPFSRFANIVCSDEEAQTARVRAHAVAEALKAVLPNEAELIGPAAAPLSKLKGHYRWHVAVRAPVDAQLSDLIRRALARMPTSDRVGISVDVDPMSMA